MKVILTESVPSLGNVGDVVTVKGGYGRNYLIPKRLAVLADERKVRHLAHQKRLLEQKLKQQLQDIQEFAKKIEATQVTITRKAGENEKLFGSVTNQDIQESLKNEGIDIDRKAIQLGEPIKALGYYTVSVRLEQSVEASLKVWVVGEE